MVNKPSAEHNIAKSRRASTFMLKGCHSRFWIVGPTATREVNRNANSRRTGHVLSAASHHHLAEPETVQQLGCINLKGAGIQLLQALVDPRKTLILWPILSHDVLLQLIQPLHLQKVGGSGSECG